MTSTVEQWAVRTCRRKQTYLSEACALNAAWLIALAHHEPTPMTPYRCPVCPDWHLTSHPRPEQPA